MLKKCRTQCRRKKPQRGILASDIADQIGGLTAIGVGQGCGTGYPLEILHKWVEKNILRSES